MPRISRHRYHISTPPRPIMARYQKTPTAASRPHPQATQQPSYKTKILEIMYRSGIANGTDVKTATWVTMTTWWPTSTTTTSAARRQTTPVNGVIAQEKAPHMQVATHSRPTCEAIQKRNPSSASYQVHALPLLSHHHPTSSPLSSRRMRPLLHPLRRSRKTYAHRP